MISRFSSLFLAVALVLSAAACTGSADQVTTTVPEATSTTPTTSSGTQAPTTTVAPDTTLPAGTESLPIEMRREIAELVAITEQIRELAFLEPPRIVVVTEAELEERVRESIAEEVENIAADEALVKLLGLLDPDVDLLALYLDLYGEQVAGYYDGETGELVVPASDEFTPLQRATLVHELIHALTDQWFGFNSVYEKLIDDQRFDEASALLAVIEGDAVLTQVFYIQQLGFADQTRVLEEVVSLESPVFDSAPQYLQNGLVFPYQEGLSFVQRLYDQGGFDRVNEAYVDPPVSTEQIFAPRRYPTEVPVDVPIVEPELDGYEVIYRSVWGALGFHLMFDQVLGDGRAGREGWGGDSYVQWFNGSEAALLIEFVGDTTADAEALETALISYATAAMAVDGVEEFAGGRAFVGEVFAFVARDGDHVVFVAAHDVAAGRQIVDSRG